MTRETCKGCGQADVMHTAQGVPVESHRRGARHRAGVPAAVLCETIGCPNDRAPGERVCGQCGGPRVVCIGDVREGTGTHHVRVRVEIIDKKSGWAECSLIRSSARVKSIRLTTLRTAYRLVERGQPTGGGNTGRPVVATSTTARAS